LQCQHENSVVGSTLIIYSTHEDGYSWREIEGEISVNAMILPQNDPLTANCVIAGGGFEPPISRT